MTLKSNNLGFLYAILLLVLFYAIPRFILICGIRVLSSFAESAYGIRVLSSNAKSASGIRLRNPHSGSAFYPNPISKGHLFFETPFFWDTHFLRHLFSKESPFLRHPFFFRHPVFLRHTLFGILLSVYSVGQNIYFIYKASITCNAAINILYVWSCSIIDSIFDMCYKRMRVSHCC
jgi:hypothetical protein